MNTNFLNSLTNFLKKRTYEVFGIILISIGIALTISFATYSPGDPSILYNETDVNISNFLGLYGSTISDFLLQSFGIISFLLLVNLISWGIKLIINKELKFLIYRIFSCTLYLILGCTFVYLTFNNSFWLVDNGNSGFVGKASYNFIYNYFPIIDSEYSPIGLILLTLILFVFASGINLKIITSFILKSLFRFFKRKNSNIMNENNDENIQNENKISEVPQQSFTFEKPKVDNIKNNIFKLPTVDLLEKNNSKIGIKNFNTTKLDGNFMEKILKDFGIEGNIQKINNGPVVNLYEFEPAPGVKVSKIINLSDDLARNTSSTSARVSVIPGKNTVGIEIPNEKREEVTL